MKKIKKLLIIALCIITTLITYTSLSNALDFLSDEITVKNDIEATKEKLHPVLILRNNTNHNLLVTYDFYVNKTDTSEFNADILVKANDSVVLELPQLHHLGDTQESRTIWFSWMEKNKLKPLQTEINTSIFSNKKTNPPTELGLN